MSDTWHSGQETGARCALCGIGLWDTETGLCRDCDDHLAVALNDAEAEPEEDR